MARWGRKGVGWYISQWLDGNGQRPTKAGHGWGGQKWTERTRTDVKKQSPQYGLFKPKKNRWQLRNKTASLGGMRQELGNSAASGGGSQFRTPMTSNRSGTWKRKIILISVFTMVSAIIAFVLIEHNLREPLMHVAKIRVKQLATGAINGAVAEQVATRVASDSLIDWKMDSGGKVSGFMLNYNEHMRITASTIDTVQGTLDELQHMPERIPLGHALDSAIISNYGPKIPISFEPLGAVKVELNTREKNAAINMVLVEVYIKVITEIAIIIPFDMEPEVVETEIPISYLLVVGDVPMYYYDSTGKPVGESAPQAPNIAVPLQPGQGISSNGGEAAGH